jgi:dTDP-4-dehydrorhamnose 3,5-epimerase-like enzyme
MAERRTTVDDCRLEDLPKISRAQGNITPVEGARTIPFEIARVYYLYDVVGGAERGGHAHRRLEQLIVAVMGAFVVVLDDGEARREIELNRAYHGLYVPPMIWRELVNFSSGAVCVVLASRPYEEVDYIRDYGEFGVEKARFSSS